MIKLNKQKILLSGVLVVVAIFIYLNVGKRTGPLSENKTGFQFVENSKVAARTDLNNTIANDDTRVTRGENIQTHDAEPYKIESIDKLVRQIYDYQIEYTEDIDLLNEITQNIDKQPEEIWTGSWVSADTWKRKKDRFSIEPQADGRFKLFPENQEPKLYTYDPEKKEFNWEMNYYGKIITSKAKFIDEKTLVLMKISGSKVALDIYGRDIVKNE